ncbi:MAG: phosphoenolpyruvate synthase PpsA [Desulfobacterium sp.]|nr:phosphoenolpyruvate synthase PpsA [Desulfobacterium sp.]
MKNIKPDESSDDADLSFKVFHDLMSKRVGKILLVSSPYDAFIMEEEGRLAERIIHEYRGLNLSRPPRITWVSSIDEALTILSKSKFDLIITMPVRDTADPYILSRKIQKKFPLIPIILLVHDTGILSFAPEHRKNDSTCRLFVWSGNTDLLLAMIKSTEDQMNVYQDTKRAMVRVIILVEDSPEYRSSILPLLYREIVTQTQKIMDDSLNEEHRILRMRARPKILIAENFEEAETLFQKYKPYVLSVFSDVRFSRNGNLDDHAGFHLCEMIKKEKSGLPLLMLSSDDSNRKKALETANVFLNKNSPSLHMEIRTFLEQYLAFGDFIFRLPNGKEVARVSSLYQMEKAIPSIPDESVYFHAEKDHFSTWLMARSEIQLASKLQPVHINDFSSTREIKQYLVACLRKKRKSRHRGVITDFSSDGFYPDMDFTKIGNGSLGGKGRGLAFISSLLGSNRSLWKKFPSARITIPKTLVITTEYFDSFVSINNLKLFSKNSETDLTIAKKFLESPLPENLVNDLTTYLSYIKQPLAVRSSSLLEDAQFQPFAGIYKTYMIPNNDPKISIRLNHLVRAIKLIYASTYFEAPKYYSTNTSHRVEEEKMAIVIQQITGKEYGGFYFPPISGVTQSYNFYPVSYMKPEDGVVHIAFGLGKTVVEGGASLRFSPRYPQFLPQYSTVEDILKNSQKLFYGLDMSHLPDEFGISIHKDGFAEFDSTLTQLEINNFELTIEANSALRNMFSSYLSEDHRIRDTYHANTQHVVSFSNILKYNEYPLPDLLIALLEIGQAGMGAPVEIEFAVNFPSEHDLNEKRKGPELVILQIRPMVINRRNVNIQIEQKEIENSFCFSDNALGNGIITDIYSIVFVKPESFDPARTIEIASEIGKLNKIMMEKNEKYILIGPGRWGSADRWLGIPVSWKDICGVAAIIETASELLTADPSQGTHFFHNITSLGIGYLSIGNKGKGFLDKDWLTSLPVQNETTFICHCRLNNQLMVKIDGKESCAVIVKPLSA